MSVLDSKSAAYTLLCGKVTSSLWSSAAVHVFAFSSSVRANTHVELSLKVLLGQRPATRLESIIQNCEQHRTTNSRGNRVPEVVSSMPLQGRVAA